MPSVSFEVFPPRSLDASFHLWDTVHALSALEPRFFSVTYGAGGSTQKLTQEAAQTLRKQSGLPVAAHLTCVGASRSDVLSTAEQFAAAGITEIVALRGDPTDGGTFKPHADGFSDSCELIAALAESGRFTLRVGAYPDGHPDAADTQQNIDWLKRKFDMGADEAITQFFFEPETFLRFRDACVAGGITKKITPGILPVTNWSKARDFAERCGTVISAEVAQGFDRASREDRADLFALAHATELCDTLVEEGVEDLHFYTLNRPDLTRRICCALGIAPQSELCDVA